MGGSLELQDQCFAVVGLGRSGLAACQALRARGASVYAWDDQSNYYELVKNLGCIISPYEEWPWQNFQATVLSPGIPHHLPVPHPVARLAQKNKVPIIVDVDLLFNWESHAKFIGITGTNGKSTTTALVGHILDNGGLKVAVGGNIGVPALSLPSMGERGVYVLELSSYQLERLPSLSLDTAALINITPDHLERHGSIEQYAQAKELIFGAEGLKNAVVSIDDNYSSDIFKRLEKKSSIQLISVGRDKSSLLRITDDGLTDNAWGAGKIVFNFRDLSWALGHHNWQNAAISYAIARCQGLSFDETLKGLQNFQGLAHRIEKVCEKRAITFVNDSKATNVEAVGKALACFSNIYWIAGGKPKNEPLTPLEKFYPNIKKAYLIGEAQESFARQLNGKLDYECNGTLEVAVNAAHNDALRAHKNAVILLSPACASFDQFRDFEERGTIFKNLVQQLCVEKAS